MHLTYFIICLQVWALAAPWGWNSFSLLALISHLSAHDPLWIEKSIYHIFWLYDDIVTSHMGVPINMGKTFFGKWRVQVWKK